MRVNCDNSKYFHEIYPGEVFCYGNIDNIYIKTMEIVTPTKTYNALDAYSGEHHFFEDEEEVSLIPSARLEIF